MLRRIPLLLLSCCLPLQLGHAEDVEIGVLKGSLKYSKSSFVAKPGAKVKLTLKNNDEIQHNLIVGTKQGDLAWKEISDKALALGADGVAKDWNPGGPLVLAATKMLNPEESQTIEFTAPKKEGAYPFVCTFPGHAMLMRGTMIVTESPRGLTDLRFNYFEGSWNNLPDFTQLKAKKVGKIENNLITLAPRDRDDQFAFVFDASLQVPIDGEYLFTTMSDDGSRLLIDGKAVVDNDGVHGESQVTGKTQLTKGTHRLQVQFFEQSGGEALRVGWSGPGFKTESLSEGGQLELSDPGEFLPQVADKSRVFRCLLPNASSRAIAVGLPGGTSFCFDASTCSINYLWTGGFLNVGPERGDGRGRGGGVCKPLGNLIPTGAPQGACPIQLGIEQPGAVPASKPKFAGYHLDGAAVTFEFTYDSLRIKQHVSPLADKPGIRLDFTITAAPGAGIPGVGLGYVAQSDAVEITSDEGTIEKTDKGTIVSVGPKQADAFSITITPKN